MSSTSVKELKYKKHKGDSLPKAGPRTTTTSHFVVDIISAANLPNADVGSLSDPYAHFWLERFNKPFGLRGVTLVRPDTLYPYWHCIRDLGEDAQAGDFLVVEIFDEDPVGSDFLGYARIPVGQLTQEPQEFPVKCVKEWKKIKASVTVRVLPYNGCTKKHLFLIRHGESLWNQGQREKSLSKMLHNDHPLNETGVNQARLLNSNWKTALQNCRGTMGKGRLLAASIPETPKSEEENETNNESKETNEAKETNNESKEINETKEGKEGKKLTKEQKKEMKRLKKLAKKEKKNETDDQEQREEKKKKKLKKKKKQAEAAEEKIVIAGEEWGPERRKLIKLFVNADAIFASPLSRALETCLLGLQGHPLLKKHPVVLLSSCREIKGIGGLDTKGKWIGTEIIDQINIVLPKPNDDNNNDDKVSSPPRSPSTKEKSSLISRTGSTPIKSNKEISPNSSSEISGHHHHHKHANFVSSSPASTIVRTHSLVPSGDNARRPLHVVGVHLPEKLPPRPSVPSPSLTASTATSTGGAAAAAATTSTTTTTRDKSPRQWNHVPPSEEAFDTIRVDPYDTYCEWWTSLSDTKKDIIARLEDFLCTIRYTPNANATIVVAHSFFFRMILKEYMNSELASRYPKLGQIVMSNAACLYVKFDFSTEEIAITHAEFLFGGLVGEAENEMEERGEK